MTSSAQTLRQLLEAEGATFSPAIQAVSLPFVGGGMGVVTTGPVQTGDTLTVLPFTSMLTTTKARFNLAVAEVTLRSFDDKTMDGSQNDRVLEFIADPPDFDRLQGPSRCRGGYHFYDVVQATVIDLNKRLSPTETMTSYIILLASLHRRFNTEITKPITTLDQISSKGLKSQYEHSVPLGGSASLPRTTYLHYTSENAWMSEWMRALPASYDNLLELSQGVDVSVHQMRSGLQVDSAPAADFVLRNTLWFKRHRVKLMSEKVNLVRQYRHCLDVLLCLRELPVGVSEDQVHSVKRTCQDDRQMKLAELVHGNNYCTLDQFLWAYNTLMSRGFAFEGEVWTMMPWVDYFNHALDANCTMFLRRCHPHKWSGVRGGESLGYFETGGGAENDFQLSYSTSKDLIREGSLAARLPLNRLEYVFEAVTTIEAGEQVTVAYGSYSDFESLLWYGFIQRPYLLPISDIISPSVQDPRSFIFFPCTRYAQQFLREMNIDTREVSHLHAAFPRLQDEGFRQVAFEHFWKQRMASIVKRSGGRLEYDKWQQALQNAFAFVFSSLQNAEGIFPEKPGGITWMDELVNDFVKTPAKPALPDGQGAHNVNSILQEKSTQLDAWCRCFAQHWQASLSATVSLVDYYGSGLQKCTLGVFGPSSHMQECIQRMARVCWSQLKSRSPSHTLGGIAALPLCSLEGTKIALLRALAWMELYSNYCLYDCDMPQSNIRTLSNDDLVENFPHVSSVQNAKDYSVCSMARTVSLDGWLLLQYLALEASDLELLAYLNFEST